MNLIDRRLWEKILVTVCSAIIILWIAIFVISPEHRFSLGTCGSDTMPMSYSTDIQPTFEESFLNKFGESEPDRNLTLPPLQRYSERKVLIDSLMDRAQITGSSDSVIGLYEFPGARLLLINRSERVTEILDSGGKLQTVSLAPVPVGSFHFEDNQTENPEHGGYQYHYENSVSITRIDLVIPTPGNVTPPLYIVNKTEIEQVFYPEGRSLATITTTGRFYVIYGQRVERVTGTSAIILDPAWKQCSHRIEISGEGSRVGETKYTIKFARSSERLLWSRLITTSDHIQVFDAAMGGTSSSQWISSDSTGCSC
ncbi:MAG: hypothetical protein WC593_00460 [Methanoregula sp.]